MISNPFEVQLEPVNSGSNYVASSPYDGREPITDKAFLESLPEALFDPESGEKQWISQSRLHEWVNMKYKKACPLKYYRVYQTREYENPESKEMQMGNIFEYLLCGSKGISGKVPEMLIGKTGKKLVDQIRIETQVEHGRQIFQFHKINLAEYVTEVHWRYFGVLSAHPDLLRIDEENKKITIIDLKYSGLLNNDSTRWNPYSWHDQTIHESWNAQRQASHYVLMAKLIYPDYEIEFLYAVFHSGKDHEGDAGLYKMIVSDRQLSNHKRLLLEMVGDLQERFKSKSWPWEAKPEFKTCRKCPVESCVNRDVFPQIKHVHI